MLASQLSLSIVGSMLLLVASNPIPATPVCAWMSSADKVTVQTIGSPLQIQGIDVTCALVNSAKDLSKLSPVIRVSSSWRTLTDAHRQKLPAVDLKVKPLWQAISSFREAFTMAAKMCPTYRELPSVKLKPDHSRPKVKLLNDQSAGAVLSEDLQYTLKEYFCRSIQ